MASAEANPSCVVVGGGPAGIMTGFLLARAGVRTVVLEKHADFLRDFRGDTVHPSTLRIIDELGLLEDFLQRPHQKLTELGGEFGMETLAIADFHRLGPRYGFIAFMPQWEFLNFLAERGRRYPHFDLRMQAEVTDLIIEADEIRGVKVRTAEGSSEIRADLVIGADGRHSILRAQAGLASADLGAPIDVLWFRIGREPEAFNRDFTHLQLGKVLITIDRGEYWQCAYVIPKGTAEQVRARGLEVFRQEIASIVPHLASHLSDLRDWNEVKLLTVAVDRLSQWSRPGLLCIGDAAHAMSPVGGVGINLAVQDAVATANLLARDLRKGRVDPTQLDAVRRRRLFPAKLVQAMQVQIHNRILSPALAGQGRTLHIPLAIRILSRIGPWRGLVARVIGFGVRPEHVRSPENPAG